MTLARAEQVAEALLYEGYMLYPYRPSAVKNRQRFNFGVIYPAGTSEAGDAMEDGAAIQTECLVRGSADTVLEIRARFLQLVERTILGRDAMPVACLEAEGRSWAPWIEAKEREVVVPPTSIGVLLDGRRVGFAFPTSEQVEAISDQSQRQIGSILRRQQTLAGELECLAIPAGDDVFRIRVRIVNNTAMPVDRAVRDRLLLHSLVSVHTILGARDGDFISLTDPPASLRDVAQACHNIRTWPVLVGEHGEHDTMLSSPIIVADYPEIAPESPGELFDGTEIDEILSLRILTLTDEEQREMTAADERARALLERTHGLAAEQLMRMHGTMRAPRTDGGEMR